MPVQGMKHGLRGMFILKKDCFVYINRLQVER